MTEIRKGQLDENDLAEADAESDLLDADLEEYGESAPRSAQEEIAVDLDEDGLAEADAES